MSVDSIQVFVEVVEAQSFTRAAGRLKMPATTVSAKIAKLEERLGVTLIQRTTRRLQVTPAGRAYYERCARALAEIAEGERELLAGTQEPSGLLRITTPPDLAHGLLTPKVERFLKAYPKTSVELIVTSQIVDLLAERIDLAVRVGVLNDSSLIIRKFRSVRAGLWASPAYLDRMGTPKKPSDLKSHNIIRFSRVRERIFLHSPAGSMFEVEFTSRLSTDDLENLRTFVLHGYGIGLLPDYLSEEMAALSPLVRILPDYASESFTVLFAYPAQRFVPLTVRAFIETAMANLA